MPQSFILPTRAQIDGIDGIPELIASLSTYMSSYQVETRLVRLAVIFRTVLEASLQTGIIKKIETSYEISSGARCRWKVCIITRKK